MDPYIGEIRVFAGNFAPRDWALCNGQQLSIAAYTPLFAVIGTTYGGNGTTTFGLPNLQGSVPIGAGQGPGLTNRVLGKSGGAAAVVLSAAQMATHGHAVGCGAALTQSQASGSSIWADGVGTGRGSTLLYCPAPDGSTTMNPGSVQTVGGGQAHGNLQPSLTLNFIIALNGIFPSPD